MHIQILYLTKIIISIGKRAIELYSLELLNWRKFPAQTTTFGAKETFSGLKKEGFLCLQTGVRYSLFSISWVPLGQGLLFWRNPAKTSCEASRLNDSHYLKIYWEINVRLFCGVIFFKTSMNFDSFLFLICLRLSVSGALKRFSETK